jgi:hypothetical protein
MLWIVAQLSIVSEMSIFLTPASFRFATLYATSRQFVVNQSGEG